MSKIAEHLKKSDQVLQPSCAVRYGDDTGVAILLATHINDQYRQGDVVIFWKGGDMTAEDGIEDILVDDIWQLAEAGK